MVLPNKPQQAENVERLRKQLEEMAR